MELFLFGGAAIVAFALAAAPVLIWASAQRERRLRDALAQSLSRIAELEEEGPRPRPAPRAFAPPEPEPAPERAPPPEPQAEAAPEPPPLETIAKPQRSFLWRRLAAPEPAASPLPEPPAEPSPPPPEPHAAAAPRAGGNAGAIAAACACALAAAAALIAGAYETVSHAAAFVLAALAGAAALASAEWLHRARAAQAPRGAVIALTLTGLAIFAAAAAIAGRQAFFSPIAAFALTAMTAAAALAYARRYGFALLTCGVALALAAPLLTPPGLDGQALQHGAILGILIFTLWSPLTGVRAWLKPFAAMGALAWSFAAAWSAASGLHVAAAAANAIALIVVAAAYAWPDAKAPLPLRFWSAPERWTPPLLNGVAIALIASAVLVVLFTRAGDVALLLAICFALVAAAAAIAMAYAEALAIAALAIVALFIAALPLWPKGGDAASIVFTAGGLAAIATFAGWHAMARAKDPAPGAALAALMPVLTLVAAHERLGAIGGTDVWAGAAGILAGLNLLFHVRMRGVRREAAAASAYALGAVLAAAAAIGIAVPEPYNIAALALLTPVLALFDHTANQRGLRIGAGLVGVALIVAAAVQAARPHALWPALPWLEPLAPVLLAAATCLLLASALFARGGARAAALSVQALTLAAFAAIALALIVALRHAAAPETALHMRLWECGAYALVLLALAAAVAWRFGATPPSVPRATAWLCAAAALALVLIWGGLALNPWWGLSPAPARGWPVLNEMFAAYAAPAAGFIAYGWLRARQDHVRHANAAGAAGLALVFVWLVLELRRVFHPGDMRAPVVFAAEAWAYSLLTLVCAGGLFVFALWRNSAALRAGALALALAALAKIALSDAMLLSGALRVGAIAAAIAAAAALIVLYNRRLLPEAAPIADPNLLPPR